MCWSFSWWTAEIQTEIWKEQKRLGVKSRAKAKKVVVRAYLPGHEECHSFRKAWTEIEPFKWNWFNWGSIWDFKARFENIYSLPTDRPARLRPDTHTAGDCLHYMTGAMLLKAGFTIDGGVRGQFWASHPTIFNINVI